MQIACKQCGAQLTPQQAGEPCPACGSLDRDLNAQEWSVLKEKAQAARELATKHYLIEPGLTHVIRFSGSPRVESTAVEPIKLLEVNENTFPSGILPLGFDAAPASGIPFPSVIVEVTPAEYERIRAKELRLPDGWGIEDELPRQLEAVGGA